MRTAYLAAGSALALVLALGGPAGAQDISLKMAHYLPTVNGMHTDFLEPWARDLEQCSDGKVAVEIFPGGTQLGNPAKVYDEVRAGVVDIAYGVSGIPGGRFERLRIGELPFIWDNAGQATTTLWSMFDEHFAQDFPGVHVLVVQAHDPGQFHMVDKEVKMPADFAGLRIRFPTEATKAMIEALGGTPVGLPPGATYENAEKGVIDGTVFSWDAMAAFKLSEVLKVHLDGKFYVTTFWFGMNQNTYDGLPDDVRQCVDDISGETLAAKFGDWWAKWDQSGIDAIQGPDHTVITLTDEERQEWKTAMEPMIDDYLTALEDKGIDDAREIYEAMTDAAAQ